MLAELEELGMQLARATAAKALADLAEPDPPEEEAEELLAEPLAEESKPEPAQAATPRRTAARSSGTTPRKTDQVTSFIRLAKAVCELIALESGLAAGPAPASRTPSHPSSRGQHLTRPSRPRSRTPAPRPHQRPLPLRPRFPRHPKTPRPVARKSGEAALQTKPLPTQPTNVNMNNPKG